MARRVVEEAPKDWRPTQAVPDPIINNPYEEPTAHWLYRGGIPTKEPERRPAGYYYKEKRTGRVEEGLFDEQQREETRDDLPLVNALRDDVKRWRKSGYRGTTPVTRELLQYWIRAERARRLFFCQQEAVETIIYLLELALPNRLTATGFKNFKVDAANVEKLLKGQRPDFETLVTPEFFPRLIDIAADPTLLPLRRLGCKMATGSGKTIVMAMLIAWAFCNRGRNPASTQFPNAVLVCSPNLTVRKRLEVLKPECPDNYYDRFELVPTRYREFLLQGRVFVTNWHKFAPKSEHHEGGKSYAVVDKGEESADAFARDRLGDLAARLPILVLNDEGHHCWRPKPALTERDEKALLRELSREEREALQEETEEARVWLAGLDKLNNAGLLGKDSNGRPLPCILACVDLSATPFYLANSGYPMGSPFPWLVCDFGLVDAIECGITKVPRLPVADDSGNKDDIGRPDPKYFRLWQKVKDACHTTEKVRNTPKAEAVYKYAQDALLTLASQWKIQFEKAQADSGGKPFIPPVLIVVCDNTDVAKIFYEKIAGETEEDIPDPENPEKPTTVKRYGGGEVFPDLLANDETVQRTIRIDTKLLSKIETEEGESKDQAALRLRELIDTVGKQGTLGEQVRCVVSVSMLTEGWDASNVTHILGIRAFESQLLCEQVVGRGLRRMTYTPDPVTGLLPAEYVDVYGIPFSLIPFKGKPKDKERPDPVYHAIYAIEERAGFEIRVPNVEGYVYELRGSNITCDIDRLEPLIVDRTPSEVWLRPTRGYHDDPSALGDTGDQIRQTRDEYYKTVRPQQIVFMLAQKLLDDLTTGGLSGDPKQAELRLRARHQLFPEIVRIVQQYIDRKVEFKAGLDPRELGLQIYARQVVERIRDNILPVAAEKGKLIPVINRFRPYNSTADVNYQTTRPIVDLTRSHLNRAVLFSDDERQAIDILEDLDAVEYFTPNDRQVGLVVPYEYDGALRSYEPDFIIKLAGGRTLMLEIKGFGGKLHAPDLVPAKNAAAKKWCAAVSNLSRYGEWVFEICEDLKTLRELLLKYADRSSSVPFEFVKSGSGTLWKDCVPLTTLRTIANRPKDRPTLDDGAWGSEWVTWPGHPPFAKGMFVAKLHGRAMEPAVRSGTYCLFRPVDVAERNGRIVFVEHPRIDDRETGGCWTVRRYRLAAPPADQANWKHIQVILEGEDAGTPPITLEVERESEIVTHGELLCSLPFSPP